jgi:2-oxoglutarate ferredoxin oxidoreductase subunit beta
LLFNNRIYGLTKGQYSPTSELGKITKSTPLGSVDHPFYPISVALGADATFVARTMDVDAKHLQGVLKRAHEHPGGAFVEILQNCNIFNDGAWDAISDKNTRAENALFLEHGKPLRFGKNREKGIRLNAAMQAEVVTLGQGVEEKDLLVHDEHNPAEAFLLSRMAPPDFPTPMGVFYAVERPTYEAGASQQIEAARARLGEGDVDALLSRGDTWVVK